MIDPTPPRASEGGHWYDPKTGQPVYQVKSADGKKMIDCTLRQARRLELVPGTTGPIGMVAAHQLVEWKIDQAIKAALNLTREPGETDESFAGRIRAEAEKIAENARTEGKAIHAALEAHYKGEPYDQAYAEHVRGTVAAIDAAFPGQKWRAEVVAVTPRYGTKIDLLSDNVIVDFKGKDFGPDDADGLLTYPQHWMQLVAGDSATGLVYQKMANGEDIGPKPWNIVWRKAAICYVSRNHPGLAKVVTITPEQRERGLAMWEACLTLWRNKNDYYPGE